MSFIRDFMYFTRYHEAPEIFQLWSGLSALSALAGRRIWFDMGHFRYHPALYVVLVGPPGVRKSTSMNVAKDIVMSVLGPDGKPVIPMSGDSTTAEAIKKDMFELGKRTFIDPTTNEEVIYSQMACFVTEFSQFLGSSDETMVDFLTAIWGEKRHIYRTKGKGTDFILGPYLTMQGCATPTWISQRLKTDVISGGMSRRTIFPFADKNRLKNALPQRTACEQEAYDRMIKFAHEVQQVAGPFTLTDAAKAQYVEWYNSLELPQEAYLQAWYNSKAEMVFKIAMLLSLGEGSEASGFSKIITADHFAAGLHALDQVESTLHYVLGNFGRNELKSVSNTLLLMLEGAGGAMSETDIKVRMFTYCHDEKELLAILEYLQQAGMIYPIRIKQKPGYCTAVFHAEATRLKAQRDAANATVDSANPAPSSS